MVAKIAQSFEKKRDYTLFNNVFHAFSLKAAASAAAMISSRLCFFSLKEMSDRSNSELEF